VLLLLAPGVWPIGRNPAPVLAGIDLFLGILAILHGVLRMSGRLPTREPFGRRNARVVLVGGAVILAAMCLVSVGGLPGTYYGSPGSVRFELGGCGAPGMIGPPALPDAFPFGAHVRLHWTSVNLQNTSFRIVQDHPNRLGAAWETQEYGTAGSSDFISTGGPVWLYAAVVSAPCPDVGSVQVTWTYAVEI
jgi:hypothetical protein